MGDIIVEANKASIGKNIARIHNAKSNMKAAIISKGVTVDDSLTIDAYADLISNIVVNQYTGDTISVGDYGMKFAYSTWEAIPSFLSFSKGWNFEGMFYNDINLTGATLTITEAGVCTSAFAGCSRLKEVTLNGAEYVADTSSMFYGCGPLTSVTIGGYWEHLSKADNMFYGCSSLTDFSGLRNVCLSLDLSPCSSLTQTSLLNTINGLYDFMGNGETPSSSQGTLTLGSTNLAKLTDEQKAIATAKGWTLA